MFMKIIRLLLLALFLHAASPAMLKAAEAEGALVLSVNPAVSSQMEGKRTTLAVKMTVPVSAVLISDAQGWAQLMFPDASTISISPDTELELAEFVDAATSQNVVLNLAAGTTRIVTGDVARRNPSAITINTPQASVGVRGTIVSVTVKGETTSVYLTETTGQGVTVIDRATGASYSMSAPGNVLEVGPSGSTERRATPAEARGNNVAARGPNTYIASTLAPVSTNPAGPSSPSGVNAPPVLEKVPDIAEPQPDTPVTPPVTPVPPAPEPPTPTPPTGPNFNVDNISGRFNASGSTLTRAATSWEAGFNVVGTRITGATLTLDDFPFAADGTGRVNADATFTINGFTNRHDNGWGDSTSMSGVFDSLTAGTLHITNPLAGLDISSSFSQGVNVDAIIGGFTAAGTDQHGSPWVIGFSVNGSSIVNAHVFNSVTISHGNGSGSVDTDGRFRISGFTDISGSNAGITPTVTGQFNSLTGGSLNTTFTDIGATVSASFGTLAVDQIKGVFLSSATINGNPWSSIFEVQGSNITNALLKDDGSTFAELPSGQRRRINNDGSFAVTGMTNSDGNNIATTLEGYFSSMNSGVINYKNLDGFSDTLTTMTGFDPAAIRGTFSAIADDSSWTASFAVNNLSISNCALTKQGDSSATATSGTGEINPNASFYINGFTVTDAIAWGSAPSVNGEFTSPSGGGFGISGGSVGGAGTFFKPAP